MRVKRFNFKRVVSAAAAAAVLSTALSGMTLTAGAADLSLGIGTETEPYVDIDFSGDSIGSKVWGYSSTQSNTTGISSDDGWLTYYVGSSNRDAGSISVTANGNTGNCAEISATGFADAGTNNKRAPSVKINLVPAVPAADSSVDLIYKFDFKTDNVSGVIYLNDDTDLPSGDYIKLDLTSCPTGTWLTAVLTINPQHKLCIADIYNGESVVSTQSNTYTTDAAPARLRFLGASSRYKYSIDNIKVYSKTADTYYTVAYSVNGSTSSEVVRNGSVPMNIPDTTVNGKIFEGWQKNDDSSSIYTSDALKSMPITSDVTFMAAYTADPDYIESVSSITVSGSSIMTIGVDSETPADNIYTASVIGDNGTDLTANPDSRVSDFNVEWIFSGFKSENDQEGQYCDSYGTVEYSGTANSVAHFKLRNMSFNFYGTVQARVIYNGATMESNKMSVVILGNTVKATNAILPESGYPSDFDLYSDELVGYTALKSTYASETDIIIGGWAMAGSDNAASAVITKEEGNKFVKISTSTGNSHLFAVSVPSFATQAIFEQDVRFHDDGGRLVLTNQYPNGTELVSVAYTSSTLQLNNTVITDSAENNIQVNADTWYKIVLSVDKSTNSCYVLLYDVNGNYIGGAENIVLLDNEKSINWFCAAMKGKTAGEIDFDKYRAYYPVADESKYTLTTTTDTISIPNNETAELTASLKTAEGYEMTGKAVWSVVEEDMRDGVIITPDENDSHKAVVSLGESASAGPVTLQVNIGGYTKNITLQLTSSAETIKFTKSSASISIPLSDSAETAEYAAEVIDGSGAAIAGRDVTFTLYDKNNANALESLPAGINFDSATGILTVTKDAAPYVFTLRATADNIAGEQITRYVKVTVHGFSFDFGTDADDALAEGYTAVTASTSYTDARGYGISSGTPAADGTASTDNAASDYLSGSYTFKAAVPAGKNYTVDITYSGTLTTGYVNSDLSGYTLGTQDSLAAASYTVPVPFGTLDLTVADGSIAAVTITKQADREPLPKPALYDIGDSTAANNGSWAYRLAKLYETSYTELAKLCSFHSSGKGGTNLSTYYTGGNFANVLKGLYPGDIVMLGNMGTNGMGASFEADFNYYLDAAEAMGAKTIINSYSPHGAVDSYSSLYNSDTNTFESYRKDSYDVTARSIAEKRAQNDSAYLGFVEIGKNADAAFNAYVDDYASNGYASRDAAAQAIIACFSDHNHYSNYTLACDLMLNGYGDVKGIVAQLAEWNIKSENIGAETTNSAKSTGFRFTVENGLLYIGHSFSTFTGGVTSNGTTKTFSSSPGTITLECGARCNIGLFVEGLADSGATASMEIQ